MKRLVIFVLSALVGGFMLAGCSEDGQVSVTEPGNLLPWEPAAPETFWNCSASCMEAWSDCLANNGSMLDCGNAYDSCLGGCPSEDHPDGDPPKRGITPQKR